jgi:hypothetical protein
MSEARARLQAWINQGGVPETDVELRLIRRLPWIVEALDDRLSGGAERALVGLDHTAAPSTTPTERLRLAIAHAEGGQEVDMAAMAELEEAFQGEPTLWIPAARLHASVNLGREAAARMSLSDQSLPYVFPGDVHPMMVDVLACGERVLPALHVDWVRKLTTWMAPLLVLDCTVLGMWFWPVLSVLAASKLRAPLAGLAGQRLPSGGRGLAAAYAARLGEDGTALMAGATELDQRIVDLVFLGDSGE